MVVGRGEEDPRGEEGPPCDPRSELLLWEGGRVRRVVREDNIVYGMKKKRV